MITLDQASEIASSHARIIGTERVILFQSNNRILAEDVFADSDMPPFNKSAMDGYACRCADLDRPLKIVELVQAGFEPTQKIGEGECAKIMTGAKVPDGADTVFMVEYSEKLGENLVRFAGTKTNSNICLKGEDIRQGELVLQAGILLKPQHIAILASVGCSEPLVYIRPSVGIISTGSELVNPEETPQPSQIRNSNGPQLYAQASAYGFPVNYYGIVPDDKELTRDLIQLSVLENEITILSGGVSMGDFDFVPEIIRELGFEIHFQRINIKPGQHTTFASLGDKYIIGLPGNPVSSYIQFEVFVLPFLRRMMNFTQPELKLSLPMAFDFSRRKSDREECLPVQLKCNQEVSLIEYHGSAHIHAYHQAFGYISVPAGQTEIKKGELVYVRPL